MYSFLKKKLVGVGIYLDVFKYMPGDLKIPFQIY